MSPGGPAARVRTAVVMGARGYGTAARAKYGRGGLMARRWPRRYQRRLTSRPDPLYPLKVKIAMDLGLLEKARRLGWGNLSSAETGRVGGWMTRLYGRTPPRSLRLWPGQPRRRRQAR